MKYIIEHLEDEVYAWCVIEYEHISEVVGKKYLIFTNIKDAKARTKLAKLGKVYRESVRELKFTRACVLDPVAKKRLCAADTEEFDYIILGGILGDYPPKERTKEELPPTMDCGRRNLGKEQMSTDTATYVAHLILNGKKFSDIEFQDGIEIELGDNESTGLPYRYVVENGKPVLPKRLIAFLKKRDFFDVY